jgi:glutathione S-transferase
MNALPRGSRAVTHRKGGLSVPDELYRGCTLFGWLASPYTAKVRSLLAYKGISFTDATPSALTLRTRITPNVGRLIMPTLRLASGEWRQDSALMCDEIEAQHPEPSTRPTGAAQHLASLLLELHADEWLPMLALHHRWNVPDNARWAVREFGRCAFPLLPTALSTRLVAPAASKMQSFVAVQGVSDGVTQAGVERYAATLIGALDAHFAVCGHAFLLGDRPCRADFALYGPIWAHLYRDPYSRALFADAPSAVGWLERLHGHAHDPAFPDLPCRASPPAAPGPFLPADQVPHTLDDVFRALFAEQWPNMQTLSAAVDAHLDEQSTAGTLEPLRVPRSLGTAPFQVGGAQGERRLLAYTAWRLRRPLSWYRSLEMAPSRANEVRARAGRGPSHPLTRHPLTRHPSAGWLTEAHLCVQLASADKWLDRIGARDAFRAVQPRWIIERESELPLERETLSATRSLF